jgi:hypothetical protein
MGHPVIMSMAKESANKKDKTKDQNKKIKEIFRRMNVHPPTNVMEIPLIFIVVIIIARITMNLLIRVWIVIAIFYYPLLAKLIITIFLMSYSTKDLLITKEEPIIMICIRLFTKQVHLCSMVGLLVNV